MAAENRIGKNRIDPEIRRRRNIPVPGTEISQWSYIKSQIEQPPLLLTGRQLREAARRVPLFDEPTPELLEPAIAGIREKLIQRENDGRRRVFRHFSPHQETSEITELRLLMFKELTLGHTDEVLRLNRKLQHLISP